MRPSRPLLASGAEMEAPTLLPVGCGEVAAFTKASPLRPGANEDALAVLPAGPAACVLVVADGLGGARAGDAASRLAIERLCEAVEGASGDDRDLRDAILDGIERAHAGVRDLGVGAATTLCVAEIRGHRVRPYHVGDSSILVTGQRGRIKLQTTPHSPVGFAVEAGVLDPSDALHHEDLHLVSNALGADGMRIEIGSPCRLAPRDTLVLATDGLTDNLHLQEILDLVRSGPLEQAAASLVREASSRMQGAGSTAGEPSKPDDLTFVVYRPSREASRAIQGSEG